MPIKTKSFDAKFSVSLLFVVEDKSYEYTSIENFRIAFIIIVAIKVPTVFE